MVQETRLIDPIHMCGVRQSPCETGFRRHVDENAEIGKRVLHGEGLNRFEIDQREVIPPSLVSQRRIDETVGYDDISTIDRRRDELGDMLGPGGAMEQCLGSRLEIAQVAVEKESPHGLTNRCAAGLPGENNSPACGADSLCKLSRLRRLS